MNQSKTMIVGVVLVGVFTALSLSACGTNSSVGCESDLECRAGRVCIQSVCTDLGTRDAPNNLSNNVSCPALECEEIVTCELDELVTYTFEQDPRTCECVPAQTQREPCGTDQACDDDSLTCVGSERCTQACNILDECIEGFVSNCIEQCIVANGLGFECIAEAETCNAVAFCIDDIDSPNRGDIFVDPQFEIETPAGTTKVGIINLLNIGEGELLVRSATLSGRDASVFQVTRPDLRIPGGGGAGAIEVSFSPPANTDRLTYSASLDIFSSDLNTPVARVELVGRVARFELPCVTIIPGDVVISAEFGDGNSPFIFENCGADDIELIRVESSQSRFENIIFRRGMIVPPGERESFGINYFFSEAGEYADTLTVSYFSQARNDPGTPYETKVELLFQVDP